MLCAERNGKANCFIVCGANRVQGATLLQYVFLRVAGLFGIAQKILQYAFVFGLCLIRVLVVVFMAIGFRNVSDRKPQRRQSDRCVPMIIRTFIARKALRSSGQPPAEIIPIAQLCNQTTTSSPSNPLYSTFAYTQTHTQRLT